LSLFVLDASVVLSWCFEDETSAYAERILDLLAKGAEAQVPAIWPLEVCNALLIAERRKRISAADSAYWINKIVALRIAISPPSHLREAGEPLTVAREYGLTMYDAAYLDLARRFDLPLATIDRQLAVAARKSGVPTTVGTR
jgi:predicted nucleic acid-binding protein